VASFADQVATIGRFIAVADPGAEAAANEMADAFKPVVQRVLLSRSHAFATKTPSPPGSPPAAISGELAASIMNTPAIGGGAVWESKSGPTTRYGRIQELGGVMTGHPTMHWWEDGVPHWSHQHSLPPRPYLAPTVDAMADSGELGDAAAAAFSVLFDAVS
jgi:hypothetical protein